jgi:hypothetical protein
MTSQKNQHVNIGHSSSFHKFIFPNPVDSDVAGLPSNVSDCE